MGSSAEMRGLVIAAVFISAVAILVSVVPPEILSGGSGRGYINPSNSAWSSILATNETTSYNLTGSNHDHGNKDFGGWHIRLIEVTTYDSPQEMAIRLEISDAWYSYFYNREDFVWSTSGNNISIDSYVLIQGGQWDKFHVLLISTLDTYIKTVEQNPIFYATSSRTTLKTYFYWNVTAYPKMTDAYTNGTLVMLLGIDFNERNTQVNAWGLITSFLTFQLLPQTDPVISLLVEIPFWVCEGYLIFIFVLRVIGAVFGGGGA